MFCPVGYRSAAELWVEFCDARLPHAYESASTTYNDPATVIGLIRGSPKDICEYIFFRSLAKAGICLASPQGDLVRVFVDTTDDHANLFARIPPYDSSWQKAALDLAPDGDELALALDASTFSAWPFEASDRDAWTDKYPVRAVEDDFTITKVDLAIQHHTLLKFVIRPSYTVSPTVQPWATEESKKQFITPIIDNYSGWSVCIDEATYNGHWQELLRGEHDFFPNSEMVNESRGAGRPRLEGARAAFAAMDFNKGDLSWEQIRSIINDKTGTKPSARALREWRDEHSRRQK